MPYWVKEDREVTLKYLEDLNLQTKFTALDENYQEHLKAVMNYSPSFKVREIHLNKGNTASDNTADVNEDVPVVLPNPKPEENDDWDLPRQDGLVLVELLWGVADVLDNSNTEYWSDYLKGSRAYPNATGQGSLGLPFVMRKDIVSYLEAKRKQLDKKYRAYFETLGREDLRYLGTVYNSNIVSASNVTFDVTNVAYDNDVANYFVPINPVQKTINTTGVEIYETPKYATIYGSKTGSYINFMTNYNINLKNFINQEDNHSKALEHLQAQNHNPSIYLKDWWIDENKINLKKMQEISEPRMLNGINKSFNNLPLYENANYQQWLFYISDFDNNISEDMVDSIQKWGTHITAPHYYHFEFLFNALVVNSFNQVVQDKNLTDIIQFKAGVMLNFNKIRSKEELYNFNSKFVLPVEEFDKKLEGL